MADEAKHLATFIIEPIGADVNSPTSYIVRKRFQASETTTSYTTAQVDDMFDDIMDQISRPTLSGSNMKGGIVYLKNGTYLLNSVRITVSDTTDDDNVSVRFIGESRDKTIIKAGASSTIDMIAPYCSTSVEDLTLHGNNVVELKGFVARQSGTSNKILTARNVRFTNFGEMGIQTGHNCRGLDVSYCIFENWQSNHDQCAFECTHWARIHDNYFDKTAGTTTGANLTSGSAVNAMIYNNIIKGVATTPANGILIEAFSINPNYENVFIFNNFLYNRNISVGSTDAYTQTYKNTVIDSNTIDGGGIKILGPTGGSYSTQVKDTCIQNNQMINSYEYGIKVINVAGLTFIRNNSIKNTNISLNATTFDKGGIYLSNTIDTICEDNFIYMDVTSPENALYSPYGIRYSDEQNNLTLRNNRIINRTLANNSYVSTTTPIGIPLISRTT